MRSEKLYGQFKGIIRNGGKVEPNDPTRAGQDASKRQYFGEFGRYAVFAVHTRFDAVCWFVTDAESIADAQVRAGEFPAVIRQEATREAAMAGLR
jgi:hypothetical protein